MVFLIAVCREVPAVDGAWDVAVAPAVDATRSPVDAGTRPPGELDEPALPQEAGSSASGMALVTPETAVEAGPPPNPGGPLAGLPSQPGPHLAQIAALGDDEWTELPQPGADPKWGRARGRSWGGRSLILAPELRGAFFYGEGKHAFVKPNGRIMDDLWFYDLNQNRWIAIYPGTDTNNFNQNVKDGKLRIGSLGVLVDQWDNPVPAHTLIHAWNFLAYDTHTRRFTFLGGNGLGTYYLGGADKMAEGLELLKEQSKLKLTTTLTPWYYDTQKGVFVREPAVNDSGGRTAIGDFAGFIYVPYLKQYFYGGSRGTAFFDPQMRTWTPTMTSGARPPAYDHGICFDPVRKRIYMGSGTGDPTGGLYIYDIQTSTWSKPNSKGTPPSAFRTNDASILYDAVNDVVTVLHATDKTIYTYFPDDDTWTSRPLPDSVNRPQHHAFYDARTNAYFWYVASDSADNGRMFVYRYKRR